MSASQYDCQVNWTRPMGQGGPLCFSSSSGEEQLMDLNWTHIYCARFSWSVTAMMMPQLEPLTGWLCLPFWRVFFFFLGEQGAFFPLSFFKAQVPCSHVGNLRHALTKTMMMEVWLVRCCGDKMQELKVLKKKNERMCERAGPLRRKRPSAMSRDWTQSYRLSHLQGKMWAFTTLMAECRSRWRTYSLFKA